MSSQLFAVALILLVLLIATLSASVRWLSRNLFLPPIPDRASKPDADAPKPDPRFKTYMVTGGSGCLGRTLIELLLAEGPHVRVRTVDLVQTYSLPRLEFIIGDVRNSEVVAKACRGVDIVFHTAACFDLKQDKRTFHEVNIIGTMNVINGCIRAGVERLIYTSSATSIISGKSLYNARESDFPNPITKIKNATAYGSSKATAETLVLGANGVSSMTTLSLRPLVIWGPRDHTITKQFLDYGTCFGDGSIVADFCYVENLAHAHLLASRAPPAKCGGKAYFISDGQPRTYARQCALLLKARRGPDARPFLLPNFIFTILCPISDYINFLTQGRLRNPFCYLGQASAQIAMLHDYTFDLSAARADLGYERKYNVDEAIERTMRYFNSLNN